VVNTATERIGMRSDTEIIRSMLDRGYLVCVVDYLGNERARTPALDWSLQAMRANINAGKYFSDLGIPAGNYKETFVVPAGYDVSLSHSFWEIDKHSAAGTLEYITKVWNTDVRFIYGERVISWVDASGKRKSVQTAYDGTAPAWLNASGALDESGSYIKIKHTLAEDVEDSAIARLTARNGYVVGFYFLLNVVVMLLPKNNVTSVLYGITMLASLIYPLFMLHLLFCCYRGICAPEDKDMEQKPSRFAFINKRREMRKGDDQKMDELVEKLDKDKNHSKK